jgi:hypothetical protein
VEEDDAEVGTVVVRLDDVAAVHVRVSPRLEHEEAPHVVEPLERVAPLVEDRRPSERIGASGHDAERLPAGVVVDGADPGHTTPVARACAMCLRTSVVADRLPPSRATARTEPLS